MNRWNKGWNGQALSASPSPSAPLPRRVQPVLKDGVARVAPVAPVAQAGLEWCLRKGARGCESVCACGRGLGRVGVVSPSRWLGAGRKLKPPLIFAPSCHRQRWAANSALPFSCRGTRCPCTPRNEGHGAALSRLFVVLVEEGRVKKLRARAWALFFFPVRHKNGALVRAFRPRPHPHNHRTWMRERARREIVGVRLGTRRDLLIFFAGSLERRS